MAETHKIEALETPCEDSNALAPDVLPPNVLPSDIFAISVPDVSPVVPPDDVCTDPKITVSTVEELQRIRCNRQELSSDYICSVVLRHQKCTMILDVDILYQKKYYLLCKKAKATLAAKTVRLQKQKDIKRLVFTSNHADKVKLRLMRDKLRQVQRRVHYNESSKTVLRKKMIDARKKCPL